ncbi:ATP-binding cassette domain-containing protein [Desulfoluna sp.]|uniref:ABC transporter ATP-binding protein n=1 Tax=Desulfoluna sp. TaxID=2045199 RepID=UPI0026136BD1|nr:ATP-binding cassette domain-containing protein [Desulfoluna sp.]
MNVLELKKIDKSYRRGGFWGTQEKREVLKGVDLALQMGTCVGLLGRSGSGKSTLGRIALNLEPPNAGEVLYHGQAVRSLSPKHYKDFRRNVQVVFQNPLGSVNPRFTAQQIVAEPLENFESLSAAQTKTRVNDLLERVGLSASDLCKYPHQFSGGELQRVCIARAIALNPKLIILDEAVSSLDMLVQLKILDLLAQLKNELGTTYLFISHDIRVLLKIADRLLVMHEGQLVEQADSMDHLNAFTHAAFLELIHSVLPPLPMAIPDPQDITRRVDAN